jgi:hypothetical protein
VRGYSSQSTEICTIPQNMILNSSQWAHGHVTSAPPTRWQADSITFAPTPISDVAGLFQERSLGGSGEHWRIEENGQSEKSAGTREPPAMGQSAMPGERPLGRRQVIGLGQIGGIVVAKRRKFDGKETARFDRRLSLE